MRKMLVVLLINAKEKKEYEPQLAKVEMVV